jgi:hypothetical protein
MMFVRLATIVGVLASIAGAARAQAPAVVQLPSFSSFGVNTSVSVPDRGSASLGGVGRSSMGSTAFGPSLGRGNRSFGSNLSGSSSSVHATIHDSEALDRDTLARAKGSQPGRTSTADSDIARRRLAAAGQSSAGRVPSGSVADAQRQRAAEVASEAAEAVANLKRAREAATAGKNSAAAMYYRLAAKQASGELKSQIDRESAALAKTSQALQMAKSRAAGTKEFSRGR